MGCLRENIYSSNQDPTLRGMSVKFMDMPRTVRIDKHHPVRYTLLNLIKGAPIFSQTTVQ